MSHRTLSNMAFLALVVCVFLLLYTRSLFGSGPLTIGVQAAAAGLMLWARLTFGRRSFHASADPTAGGLVTNGPYRWLRHPIYAAVFWFIWAGVAAHLSLLSAALAVGATAMLGVRIWAEETLLVRQYPAYADYARTTRRIVPFVF